MQIIKVNGATLTLPPETVQRIGPNDEFTVIMAGDTIILKRITPLRLSEVAKRAPKDKAMSMSEISQEVHRYRRSRRARRR